MSALHARGRSKTKADERRRWRTPREALIWVQTTYKCIIDLDAAAMPESAVASRFFCPVPELGPHYGLPCSTCLRRGRRLLWWAGAPYCAACGEAQFGERWWDALRGGSWTARALLEGQMATVWLNCPWGPQLPGVPGTAKWVDRAIEEFAAPGVGLGFLLVPTATDTRWWWAAAGASAVAHDLGRLRYRRPDGSPGPSPPQSSTLFVMGQMARERSTQIVGEGAETALLCRTKITFPESP